MVYLSLTPEFRLVGTYGMINTTISKGKGIAGEYEYVLQAPRPASAGKDGSDGGEGGEGKKKAEDLTPFRPANAFASKRMVHVPYIHDPIEPKLEAEHQRKVEESKRLATTGPWRPNMSYKSDMVRSVVKMNIPRC